MEEGDEFSTFSDKAEHSLETDYLKSLTPWVVAFCTIRFDLEKGQVLEECYPTGILSDDEELAVAFNSFPDSVCQHQNQSSLHDCIFFFRTTRHETSDLANEAEIVRRDGHSETLEGEGIARRRRGHGRWLKYLYGYVFNRQRYDGRLKRGGEQKSVVILSYHPYSSVFKPLLQILGPLYFDIGKKALEQMSASVSKWPLPQPGKQMELQTTSGVLKVSLPPAYSLPFENGMFKDCCCSSSSSAPLLPTNQAIPQGLFHDSDIFGTFKGIIIHLWVLWELLLVGEPILIVGSTPTHCSEAVAGLVSLLAPLLCSVDFRPYFTIHDQDFKHLNSHQGDALPSMVLGVTNLFFLKVLHNFPHIVSVGQRAPARNWVGPIPYRSSNGRISGRWGPTSLKQLSLYRLLSNVKFRRDGPLCLLTEHKEAIWSTYTSKTKPDISILNKLVDSGFSRFSPLEEESISVVNNEILRRHFLELTTNFLAPFFPYFRAITPTDGSLPFLDPPPPLPKFDPDEFLVSLSARGIGKFLSKRMRSNWLDLYKRFLNGPNFMPWFQRKRAFAEQELHDAWRQARMKINIKLFMHKMSELEIIDAFEAIERHLHQEIQQNSEERTNPAEEEACWKLRRDLQAVFNVLPKDVQQLLAMSPQRAALLQTTDQESI